MDQITRLARFSVLRASGFCGLAILMVMMGAAYNPVLSFLYGALGLALVAAIMGIYARYYHVRRRIDDTEVWIMLPKADRPDIGVARTLIVNAMREQLLEKSGWWANLSRLFLTIGLAMTVSRVLA